MQGYYKNDSGHPDDRVFESFTSPESEPRLIIVAERGDDDDDDPTPTPTTRPDVGSTEADPTPESESATPEPTSEGDTD